MHSVKVRSDRYGQYKKKMEEFNMSGMMGEKVPIDLYGKRVFPDKGNKENLKNAGKDIKEHYDLEGDAGIV